MNVCHFCGNKHFKHVFVQYTYKRDQQYMIVEDVPCEQCVFCGEQYFEAGVLKQIEAEFEEVYTNGKKVHHQRGCSPNCVNGHRIARKKTRKEECYDRNTQ